VATSTNGHEIFVPTSADGLAILEISRGIPLFDSTDVDTIQELWTEFITRGDSESWYHFIAACQNGKLTGFACYGRRPLTEGTYDLYWIAVENNHRRQGIGEFLLKHVESEVQARGGHLLIAETAGKPIFEPTRRFYLGSGYELEGRLRDFYAIGDDLCIFTKHFPIN
jgi:ribosomal protein S18 acetylase RimI-like enzyme